MMTTLIAKFKTSIYWQYLGCFLLAALLIFAVVPLTGSTLIWNSDGITQHYPALVYWRRMLKHLLTTHQWWSQWNWNLGLGQDTIQTFSYYVMGDVFTYPSVLFKESSMTTYYSVMVVIRLFLAGLAFIFCVKRLHHSTKNWPILTATFVYLFSGYSAYVTFAHPFFLNPMIITPLLVAALHRTLRTGKMGWLILMTAWTLFNNFYLGAITGLGLAIYWLVALVTHAQWRHWQSIARVCFSVIVGSLISAVLFIPSLYQLTIATRSSSQLANGMTWYPLSYYLTLPGLTVSNYARPYWVTGGILVIGIIACTWSLRRFRRYLTLNLLLITGGLILLSPILAALMNGGSSPSNRWTFLLMIPISITVIEMLSQVNQLTKRDFVWFGIVALVIMLSLFAGNKFKFTYDLGSVMVIYFATLLVLLLCTLPHTSRLSWVCLTGLILGFTMLNGVITMRDRHTNQFSTKSSMLISAATAHQLTNTQQAYRLDHKSTTRSLIDGQLRSYTDKSPADNLPILARTHNINSYWSLQSAAVDAYNAAMENNTSNPNDTTNTVDDRALMLRFLGVSRLFLNTDNLKIPAGYEATGEVLNNQRAYQATSTMPLIYQSPGVMSTKTFNQLSASQREVALLSNTVTNQMAAHPNQQLLKKAQQLATSVLPTNADQSQLVSHISVHNPTTQLTPTTITWAQNKQLKGYELHAQLTNIHYQAGTFRQRHTDALDYYIASHNQDIMMAGAETDLRYNPTLYNLNWLRSNVMSYAAETGKFSIGLNYNGVTNQFEQTGSNDLSFYTPRSATTLNLGTITSTSETQNSISLTLPATGTCSFDLTLWAVPTGAAVDHAIAQNTAAHHIRLGKNQVTATYRASQKTILATTIPYSKGWQLNGHVLPKVNQGFIGIPVHRGTNHIRLTYHTPYLAPARWLSILGIIGFLGATFGPWEWRRRHQSR